MASPLDLARFVLGAGILVYAAVRDLRTRRVPNPTWLWGAGAGAVILVADWAVYGAVEWWHLVWIPLVVATAYVLWYFYLIAGGADAKAIMMLAVLVPVPLRFTFAGTTWPLWSSPFPPALVVFANSLLVFVLVPVGFLLANLARGHVRFPAMFLGYQVSVERAERSFVWPMERVTEGGRTRTVLFASKLSPEENAEVLRALREAGHGRVWVTPKVPFMVPLLAGFVAAFLLGDVFTRWLVEPWLPVLRGLRG